MLCTSDGEVVEFRRLIHGWASLLGCGLECLVVLR